MAFLDAFMEDSTPRISKGFIPIGEDVMTKPIELPFIYIQGALAGKTIVLTSGIHGDELNGQKVIHELLSQIDVNTFPGRLICFPVCNTPGYLSQDRYFSDGIDLNHIMGTTKNKLPSHGYQQQLLKEILLPCDVHIDLHSERKHLDSCVFAYADLSHADVKAYAMALGVDVVIDHPPTPTTLRGVFAKHNCPSITVEIGNALSLQKEKVEQCLKGIKNIINGTTPEHMPRVCSTSTWQMCPRGGYSTPLYELLSDVKKGDVLGSVSDVLGNHLADYVNEHDGILLGVNVFPQVAQGDKLFHIGLLKGILKK